MSNYFTELNDVNCLGQIEKKGGFSYLSWPFAVGELLKRHPDATWRVYENAEGWPYHVMPAGCFVKVGCTVNGIERIQFHPVLNHQNKTVKEPCAFQVNTSIQRGLVKAIALHGLGLYIYAGEDLPEAAKEENKAKITPSVGAWDNMTEDEANYINEIARDCRQLLAEGDVNAAHSYIHDKQLDNEQRVALNTLFDSKERSAMKKQAAANKVQR
jgi:hypothetical protein